MTAAEQNSPPPRRSSTGDTVTDVVDVLARSLHALGAAGRPVAASRLAARAWWMLRDERPREAERINGTMHYLARLPPEEEHVTATASTPNRKESP